MKRIKCFVLCTCVLWLVGCATPIGVKQALISMDEAYGENQKAMKQYRTLMENINTRSQYWYIYNKEALLLNTFLECAISNPKEELVDINKKILGETLLKKVNDFRLKPLTEVKNKESIVVFNEGNRTMNDLITGLPGIVGEIKAESEKDFLAKVSLNSTKDKAFDYSAFDEYQKDVGALRQINAMVKTYLDIDITVKAEDVKEIANNIRALKSN